MKRFLLTAAIAALWLLAVVASQVLSGETGKIRGKIINLKTKAPIPFAVVQIDSTTMGAQADVNGEYLIINVPPGKYRLCARVTGYAVSCVTELTVSANTTTTQDFNLEESAVETEAQIVTAQRDLLKQTATANLRQITPEEIKNMPVKTVQDVLQAQTGVVEGKNEARMRGKRAPLGYCDTPPPIVRGGFDAYWMAHGGTTPPNGEDVDAMFFKAYGVNPFIDTDDDHLSTFAIDCDNASYTMARAYLNDGNLPPEEAIRVEEFVNNFKYDYRFPHDRAFDVAMEAAPSRFGKNYQLLKVGIVGKKIDPAHRLDANLVFVVDVSGSMDRENRLGLVRRSLRMLVDQLTPRDRVGIVVYGSNAWVELEPTSIKNSEAIINAIERLYPSGSTFAEAGIKLGYQMADRMFERGKINRIILCSDGVANVGQTGAEEILKSIKQYADKGITLSSIGFGMGNYNDVLLEKLGDKGNGHYAYVDTWEDARRVFLENLTGTLQVIARDVKIQVDFNPQVVERYRLLGYENRDVADEKFRDDKEDGGEIGSGHTVTALYEIKLKEAAPRGEIGTIFVRYKDPENFGVSEIAERIDRGIFQTSFDHASVDFRLAAAAAEFSEIMRGSYWAKGSNLGDVLAVVRALDRDRGEDRWRDDEGKTEEFRSRNDDQLIELMDMIAKADRLRQERERRLSPEPFGMQGE